MQKVMFALVALMTAAPFASARSLHPDTFLNVRLQVDVRPLRPMIGGGGVHSGIIVKNDGEVVYYDSHVEELHKNKRITVKHLSPAEMRGIESDILVAAEGEMDEVVELCEAIPTNEIRYTANRGKVLLQRSASPCGGRTENTSPEAKELVELLGQLLREGRALVGDGN